MTPQSPLFPLIGYRHRPALRLLIGCLLGIVLYESGYFLWGSIVLGALSIIALILSKRIPTIELLMWLSIVGILFGAYLSLRARPIDGLPLGSTLYQTPIRILYPIGASAESQIQYKAQIQLPQGQWLTIQLHSPKEIPDCYGKEGRATLDLSSLHTITSRGYRNYLKSEGVQAEGHLHTLHTLQTMSHPPLISRLQRFRQYLIDSFELQAHCHIPWQDRGLIYALALGDRSYLSKDLKKQFAASGVAHILAVSGYHLGIVYGLLSLLMGKLLWRHRYRHYRYGLILLFLVLYTLLTGASVATVRALLMSSIILGAKLIDRPVDPIQMLSLILLLLLFHNPFAYYSIGLLLSVSAVWGIYTFAFLIKLYLRPHNRRLQWLSTLIAISLSAQVGVLPILLTSFGTASLSFLWSNIPITILTSLLIPVALLSFLIVQVFGSLPTFLLVVLRYLASATETLTYLFTPEYYGINLHAQLHPLVLLLYYPLVYLLYRKFYQYAFRHRMWHSKATQRETFS
ncbi:ComEC/Rec2 family competence protein [Porphyromonas levii]|uniref:ComEC/Rec2 family competence protein n=1 Tax=Porphyromonas levii TaxID=28114 RepID=UPI001B8ACC20|nr:ComEC/Rec2 family competence protein [Porphyromonas levii]